MDETLATDGVSSLNALVFAIAHEVGNHLGAVRLQAHLLDEDLDAHALALASVEIDGLAGRAGPLLALLRPLLSQADRPTGEGSSASLLLEGVRLHYEDEGTRGVSVEISAPVDSLLTAPKVDWLHSLLIVILDATLAAVSRGATIRVGLGAVGEEASIVIDDDGPEEDLSTAAALRGRPLALSLGRALLLLVGGRVETSRVEDKTRVELVFPDQPDA